MHCILYTGCLGGLTSCFALVPTDNIKCKLQYDPTFSSNKPLPHAPLHTPPQAATPCKGVIDCVRSIIRQDGIRGLYKGFIPTAFREG